jgi:hypothetical protein
VKTDSNPFRIVVAPAPADWWHIPSMQDEIAYYAQQGWTWTSADRNFDFADSPNPLPSWSIIEPNKRDIHADFEGDDLWVWQQQIHRGYTDSALIADAAQRLIPVLWRDRWLQYYKESYLPHGLMTNDYYGDSTENHGDMCHVFIHGLCLYGVKENDQAAIDTAGDIMDHAQSVILRRHGATYPLPTSAVTRMPARIGEMLCHLVEATGAQKWIDWRDQFIELFVDSSNWMEAPAMGMVAGTGFYHRTLSEASATKGWNGYTLDDWNAGIRLEQTFYMALEAHFLWYAHKQTGRADVRSRLIKLAYFVLHYGVDPSHAIPLCGHRFGHQNGAIYHQQANGQSFAGYDFGVVNLLVWGYKLTGDAALLACARLHFRQASKYQEGYPVNYGAPSYTGTGHHCADSEVWSFLDVRGTSSSGYQYFTWGKGALQHAYAIFENGGDPEILP